MMIEGSRTGEEKQISAVERRESVPTKPSTPLDNGVAKENLNNKDLLKIKKLEAEIKKLQELLKRRTLEKEDATRRAEDFQHLLDETSRKLSEREVELQGVIRQRTGELEASKIEIASLLARLKQYEMEQSSLENGSKSAADRHAAELKQLQAQLERVRSEMLAQMEASRIETRQQKDINATLEKKLAAASAESAARESKLEKENSSLRADVSRLMSECDQLKTDMKSREKSLEEWKQRIDQCRNYIVKICQPQFAVVKDDSLVPVQPGTQEAGGFVLVPLSLMLEGYTLLPQDMKKKIADEYESSKKVKR